MRDLIYRSPEYIDWIVWVKALILALIAISYRSFTDHFHLFLQAPINDKYSLHTKNFRPWMWRFNILMFVVCMLILSLFAWYVGAFLKEEAYISDVPSYWMIALAFTLFFTVKIGLRTFLLKMFGFGTVVWSINVERATYINYGSLFLLLYMLITNPLHINEEAMLAACVLFAAICLLGVLKSAFIHKEAVLKNIPYYILYLCALDVAPFLVIYKIASRYYA